MCKQLIQQNVQKSSMTSLPRRSASFRGRRVLNHSSPFGKSGARTVPAYPVIVQPFINSIAVYQTQTAPIKIGAGAHRLKGCLLLEVISVDFQVLRPLLRQIIFEEDRFHRANLGTDTAVDALIRVDEVHFCIIV
jgi:hypothetical protein